MRIIAGAFKGRRLKTPAGRATRPTADRVREALFSILGSVEGLRVLDLFAGSGALGIEALSRSAADALFVDADVRAVAAIRANLAEVGFDASVQQRDAPRFLESWSGPPFDLVFVDPPYSFAARLGDRLSERLPAVASENARIVVESSTRNPLRLDLPLLDERAYGDTRIAIHRAS
jgi:16S rRNA (guanine966-N2)-methyltransferase